jgi:hypothetical protein
MVLASFVPVLVVLLALLLPTFLIGCGGQKQSNDEQRLDKESVSTIYTGTTTYGITYFEGTPIAKMEVLWGGATGGGYETIDVFVTQPRILEILQAQPDAFKPGTKVYFYLISVSQSEHNVAFSKPIELIGMFVTPDDTVALKQSGAVVAKESLSLPSK